MNRLLPLIFLGAALFVSLNKAYAQPTVYIDPDFILIDSLEQTCLQFKTRDFTDIQEMRFTVRYNPAAVTLVNIPPASLNASLTGLDIGDFFVDPVEGYVIFTWKVQNLPGCVALAETLPDDAVLFELCFEGIEGYSEIVITDDPEDIYVTRLNSCPLDIGLFIDNGFIAVDNQPLTVNVPFVNANNGEIICMDFTVENFTDIVSFQFSVNWYSSVLKYVSYAGFLPGMQPPNVNQPLGFATFSWLNPDPTQGLSVANGATIFQLCFEVTGSCGQTSPVSVTSDPTPIEIIFEGDEGIDVGVLNGDGAVSVNCFNPNGLSINLPDVSICPGESFCMDVTADNFDDLVGFQFSLNWNPDVIQFTSITNINSNLFTFNMADFNTAGSNNGFITVDWDDPSCFGEILPDDAVLFTVCFASVGGGDVNTTVAVTGTPLAIEVLDQCLGNSQPPNTFNGFVDVCDLPGVVVIAGGATANPGESVCVNIDVQQFEDVESLQFSLIWETSVLDYTGVSNFGLTGLSASNFDISFIGFGAICLSWTAPGAGETLPDGTTLFEICFNAIGDPFECSTLSFTEFPCLVDVVTGESNGTNVGIEPVDGEICMLNPFNFGVTPTSIDGFQNTILCVDFEVTNFISLEEVNFSINWDPAILLFSTVNNQNLTGFNSTSYDDSNATFGLLGINWTEPVGNGLSLPNGASMFEVCFIVTGDPGECTPISITGTPQPIIVIPDNSGGTNIGLVTTPGEVCSSLFLSMGSVVVTGVDCVGDNSGAIDITVTGGSGVYNYSWSGPGIVPPNNTSEDLANLINGNFIVTVQDQIYLNLTFKDTITVGFSANAPVAAAGADTTLPCGEVAMDLDGSGSSQGPQYSYLWTAISGGFVAPGTEITLTPTIVGSGLYELAVTDITTSCKITDTLFVEAATSPGVDIASSGDINCLTDTIQLSGLGSSFGPEFTYAWTTVGGAFVPGNEDSLMTEAIAGGWYFFTVTNTTSGCSTIDSVEVLVDTIQPIANAGMDQLITCSVNVANLDGTGSSSGPNIAYQWYDPQGDPLSTNPSIPASEPGTYVFDVTNTVNFCQASDSVVVTADTQLPTAMASASGKINCTNAVITLQGTGSSTGAVGEFTYLWTGPGVVSGTENLLNAQANLPGPYALSVIDNGNTCQSLSVVLVQLDTLPPFAEAGPISTITCTVNQATLNGTGSSNNPVGQYTYLWTGPGVQAGTETSLMATATTSGLYTLTVTNTLNGCTKSDTVSVLNNSNNPISDIASPAGTLNCLNQFVTLNATGSSQGAQFQYTWSGPFCINTSVPLMPVVGCSGTFTLTVTNTQNGCVDMQSIFVPEDTNDPIAEAFNSSFDCNDTEIQLDGTASSQGAVFTYEWTVIQGPGAITSGVSTLTPTVNGPGAFGLEVTNTQNGCIATDIAQVVADTIPPGVNAGPDSEISCIDLTTVLFGSSDPNVTYQWLFNGTPIPGATSANYTADEAGTYTLEATSTLNGCTGSDDAEVAPNNTPPLTDAGPDQDLGCEDETVVLDGSGSDSGLTITYAWTVLSGLLDPGTVADPIAVAQEAGTYVLTVTNQTTGCSGSDTVVVNAIIGLPLADASFGGDPCEVDAFLLGNLPEGTTGIWTVNTTADIEDPTNPSTNIFDLAPGINIITWTLSSPNCPNYSTYTDTITVAGLPIANNDIGEITGDVESVEIDLLANDLLLGIDYTLNIVPFPGPGTVEPQNPLDGVVTYFASALFAGNVEFQYALCNINCPDLCDTAFVRITIDKEIDLDQTVPNGITPNGDGTNETLIFDILLADPTRYPNNSLIIFNRWGDVVFQAAPYNNDWDGSSSNGPLPAGTYYFILRLDIDDSDIVRGDITIVR